MDALKNILHCGDNYIIAGIVGGVTAVISILCILLPKLLKGKPSLAAMIGVIATFICSVISTMFCFNYIVLAGYIISVICLGICLTNLCRTYHQNTIYDLSPLHLFAKLIIPVSVIFEMFRPYFIAVKDEANLKRYSIPAGFGLNCFSEEQGKFSTVITAEGISIFGIELKKINMMTIFLLIIFVAIIAMQILLILRQFKDPDNARDWADIGIVVTCIGAIFVYGMYTSNNFGLVSQSKVEHVSLAIPVVVIIGLLNRVLYFTKVEDFLDKVSGKIFKKA